MRTEKAPTYITLTISIIRKTSQINHVEKYSSNAKTEYIRATERYLDDQFLF